MSRFKIVWINVRDRLRDWWGRKRVTYIRSRKHCPYRQTREWEWKIRE